MAYRLRFGSYDFPSGFSPVQQESPTDLAEQERPRSAGSVTQVGRHQSRRLVINGSSMGFGGGVAAIQSAVDAIRAATQASGATGQLWFGRDDRYINAQLSGITESYPETSGEGGSLFGAVHKLSLQFLASDPFFYATSATTVTGLAAGGTVTPGGNASARPAWTFTVNVGGAGTITLTNTTTGEQCVMAAPSGSFSNGDVIVIDRAAYTVTLNGVASAALLSGIIPRLTAGANTIAVALGSGTTLTSLTCVYTARWLD